MHFKNIIYSLFEILQSSFFCFNRNWIYQNLKKLLQITIILQYKLVLIKLFALQIDIELSRISIVLNILFIKSWCNFNKSLDVYSAFKCKVLNLLDTFQKNFTTIRRRPDSLFPCVDWRTLLVPQNLVQFKSRDFRVQREASQSTKQALYRYCNIYLK